MHANYIDRTLSQTRAAAWSGDIILCRNSKVCINPPTFQCPNSSAHLSGRLATEYGTERGFFFFRTLRVLGGWSVLGTICLLHVIDGYSVQSVENPLPRECEYGAWALLLACTMGGKPQQDLIFLGMKIFIITLVTGLIAIHSGAQFPVLAGLALSLARRLHRVTEDFAARRNMEEPKPYKVLELSLCLCRRHPLLLPTENVDTFRKYALYQLITADASRTPY